MPGTAREVVERMLDVGRKMDIEGFIGLMAPDGWIEWPFRPPDAPARLTGHAEIRAFLTRTARLPLRFDEFRNVVIHETVDPEVVITEYEANGVLTTTGEPYRQRIIAVFRVRDGLIVSYRDYLDSLVLASARIIPPPDDADPR